MQLTQRVTKNSSVTSSFVAKITIGENVLKKAELAQNVKKVNILLVCAAQKNPVRNETGPQVTQKTK